MLLTLGAHAHRGLRYLVCPSVCLSVWLLELQTTKRHVNGTLVFSATTARKIMWPIWLKRLRSGKRQGVVTPIESVVRATTGVTICDRPKSCVTPWLPRNLLRDPVTGSQIFRAPVTGRLVAHFQLIWAERETCDAEFGFFFNSIDVFGSYGALTIFGDASETVIIPGVINPRRACAARVTVLVSVCLSVC